jgi:predicted RNA binding protein YcfA (HicA-like mRNA interferase family)
VKTKELVRALERAGVFPERQQGGDLVYRSPVTGRFLTISIHQSEACKGVASRVQKILREIGSDEKLKGNW